MHRWHFGRASSHLTFRVLVLSESGTLFISRAGFDSLAGGTTCSYFRCTPTSFDGSHFDLVYGVSRYSGSRGFHVIDIIGSRG